MIVLRSWRGQVMMMKKSCPRDGLGILQHAWLALERQEEERMKKQARSQPGHFYAAAAAIASELRVDPRHPGTKRLARAIELAGNDASDRPALRFPQGTSASSGTNKHLASAESSSVIAILPITPRIKQSKSLSGQDLDERMVHASVSTNGV